MEKSKPVEMISTREDSYSAKVQAGTTLELVGKALLIGNLSDYHDSQLLSEQELADIRCYFCNIMVHSSL